MHGGHQNIKNGSLKGMFYFICQLYRIIISHFSYYDEILPSAFLRYIVRTASTTS